MNNKKGLSPNEAKKLLSLLGSRFGKNSDRHPGIEWANVQAKLEADKNKLWSLHEMERTGGEPDVVGYDKRTGEYLFYDCSPESPAGRRNVCYDREAQDARKENKPALTSEAGVSTAIFSHRPPTWFRPRQYSGITCP